MFLRRTLEAIDTPKEQAHKGSVEKIVNLKGLLKSPWTLMDDVWEEGIFPSSESSWISTNIFFKGPSIFQRKVYWLIMRIVIFCSPVPPSSCHHLSSFGLPPPPPRVMTSFMNSPLFPSLQISCQILSNLGEISLRVILQILGKIAFEKNCF